MNAPQNFRSALGGFNREDVVRYLEYINAKHHEQVEQLRSENEYLRSQLDQGGADRQELAALRAQVEELLSIRAALEARCAGMEKELEEAEQKAAAQNQVHCHVQQELDAYRRAEQAERQARERAERISGKANGILADASLRLEAAANDMTALANSVLSQLDQLCTAVEGSKDAIRQATDSLYTLNQE